MSVNLEKMPECSVGLIGGVIKEWGGSHYFTFLEIYEEQWFRAKAT